MPRRSRVAEPVAGQLRGADDWYVSGVYVALGDSMSIDDYAGGAGRGAASLLYRNCDADFPEWAGRELAATGLQAQILAQDGATAADVFGQQLPLIEQPPAVVTLTMGGNDLLAIYGNSAAAETAIGDVIAAGEEILSRLNAASGGARIVVTTVYDPSDGIGDADATGLLRPWPEGPAVLRALNAALTGLARRHGALVADVHGCFLGHGATAGAPSQVLSRPASRNLWYCNLIEPNAWGAHEIRRTWWQALHPGR
jgi:lysophospholipase L1-like esterase